MRYNSIGKSYNGSQHCFCSFHFNPENSVEAFITRLIAEVLLFVFFHCYDQIPNTKQQRVKGFLWGPLLGHSLSCPGRQNDRGVGRTSAKLYKLKASLQRPTLSW